MTHLINPKKWLPIGVEELEPAAWDVVRSQANRIVIAGPGAGKTELLAQRDEPRARAGRCIQSVDAKPRPAGAHRTEF